MKNNIVEIINTIDGMSGESLADKILDYCETYGKDEREIGELLQESDDFKKLLYKDCIKHHSIKDEDYTDKLRKTEEITPW